MVRKVNFLQGRPGLRRLGDHGEPDPGGGAPHPGGGFGLHDVFIGWATAWSGPERASISGSGNPVTDTPDHRAVFGRQARGQARCKAALQRSFGLPQRRKVPLFGMTGRLVTQKGLDLILQRDELLGIDAQFVFLGSGEPRYERALVDLASRRRNRIGVQLDFTDRLEHRLMAGADIFLMPSLYEPCGLTQMRAQRYGRRRSCAASAAWPTRWRTASPASSSMRIRRRRSRRPAFRALRAYATPASGRR